MRHKNWLHWRGDLVIQVTLDGVYCVDFCNVALSAMKPYVYCSTSIYLIQMLESNVFVTNVAPGPVCTDVSKNALKGDGSKFGRTDKLIAEGMPVKRYDLRIS